MYIRPITCIENYTVSSFIQAIYIVRDLLLEFFIGIRHMKTNELMASMPMHGNPNIHVSVCIRIDISKWKLLNKSANNLNAISYFDLNPSINRIRNATDCAKNKSNIVKRDCLLSVWCSLWTPIARSLSAVREIVYMWI